MENPCEKAGMTIYILAILSVLDARIWYRGSLKISKLKQLFRELNVAPKCCLWTTETLILSASFVMMQQILKRRIEETAWKWSRLFPMHNEVIIPSPLGVDIWLLSRLERSGWLWKKYPASIIGPKKKHTLDHRGKKNQPPFTKPRKACYAEKNVHAYARGKKNPSAWNILKYKLC